MVMHSLLAQLTSTHGMLVCATSPQRLLTVKVTLVSLHIVVPGGILCVTVPPPEVITNPVSSGIWPQPLLAVLTQPLTAMIPSLPLYAITCAKGSPPMTLTSFPML